MPGENGAGVNGGYDGGFGAEYGNGGGYDVPRERESRPYVKSVAELDIEAQERTAAQTLKLDRDKFEFLKNQAALPAGGYPSLAIEQDKAAPSIMPIVIVASLVFYLIRKRGKNGLV